MGILDRILRAGEGKRVKALQAMVPDINALEPAIQRLTDDQLRAKTTEFRERLANGAGLDDVAIEAFAVVREAATRTIGQRHFDVQLMGGAALHFGMIAEMKTGEGKTRARVSTWSRSTTTWRAATPSGWVRSTAFSV